MCNKISGNSYIGKILTKEFSGKTEVTSADLYNLDKNKDNKPDLDSNGDGKITAGELKAFIKKEGIDTRFSKVDLRNLEKEAITLTQLIQKGGSLTKHEEEPNKLSFDVKINNVEKAPSLESIKADVTKSNQFVLKTGQSGPEIKKIQILLNTLNKDNPDFVPFDVRSSKKDSDFVFDEKTAKLVSEFQKKGNPPLIGQEGVVAGVINKETLEDMEKTSKELNKSDDPYSTPDKKIEKPQTTTEISKKEERINEVREKIKNQLKAKGLSDDQINQAFTLSKDLFKENELVGTESEARTGIKSAGYCASGVKEAMQRELNMEYLPGDAKAVDTPLRTKYKDIFSELKLTQDDIMNLPPELGVVVVHEHPTDPGHIAVYSTEESPPGSKNFSPVQMSDRERNKFSYPSRTYSVFIPTGKIQAGDRRYNSDKEAYSVNSLEGNVRRKAHKDFKYLTKPEVQARKDQLAAEGYNPFVPTKTQTSKRKL